MKTLNNGMFHHLSTIKINHAFFRPWAAPAVLFLLVLLFFSCAADAKAPEPGAQKTGEAENEYGSVFTFYMNTAPFPHLLRQFGYSDDKGVYPFHPHYDNPTVLVFVPRGFKKKPSTDVVVFLHGWYGSADGAANQFSLYRQFAQSRANAVFVIPQGPWNAPDSFGGKLEDPKGFEAFVGDVLKRLSDLQVVTSPEPRNVVILSHSGSYHTVAKILANANAGDRLREIVLFDALFGYLPIFEEWIAAGKGRFVALFWDKGSTAANSYALMRNLKAKGVRVRLLRDVKIADLMLFWGKALFIRSSSDHYGILVESDQIRRVLAKSPILRHYI